MQPTHPPEAFERLVAEMRSRGLKAEWYSIPDFPGYATITGEAASDVHCVEIFLGEAHEKAGHDAYLLAQTFHPRHPSLAILTMVERDRRSGAPSPNEAVYSVAIDREFSGALIPVINRAFNALDPTGRARSQHVQAYHAKMTYGDLVKGFPIFVSLVRRFKKDGQLANIAVDYDDPLIRFVATILRPTIGRIGDIHWVPRTPTASKLRIPVRNPAGGFFTIANHSTALDEGIRIACRYLDDHYRKNGGEPWASRSPRKS